LAVALLCLALLATPLAGKAQPAGKVYRVALVHPATPAAELTEEGSRYFKMLFSELRRLGYVEGKNLVVERRSAEGRTERFRNLAKEVVKLKPDIIVAVTSRLVQAFKAATVTIPIVGLTADPVAEGLVASLARPGGNITGVSITAGDEILGKHLQLLQEAVPTASRVAFLVPRAPWEGRYGRVMRDAAQRAGLTLVGAPLSDPIQETEYRRAFAAMSRERTQAVIVGDQAENFTHRRVIVDLATHWRLPAIYPFREFVELGGLMAYATDLADLGRQAAGYIDRILKGANPGDLPYQQPTKFELVINVKTAKTLGLSIPPSVLARADELIQ
jgi:ABC-type uncharacterized transport system substrate-binding protein